MKLDIYPLNNWKRVRHLEDQKFDAFVRMYVRDEAWPRWNNLKKKKKYLNQMDKPNSFHNDCINEWLSKAIRTGGAGNTCPMCREYICE